MHNCIFCGLENLSETARFCDECGSNGPSKDWLPEDIDLPINLKNYMYRLSEFYFDNHPDTILEKIIQRNREKLKISYDNHLKILKIFEDQRKTIAHFSNFRFEFNENIIEAYAGHDTFLNFRYTNLSRDDFFKIDLFWDDPQTVNTVEINTGIKVYVKPQKDVEIGTSVIFDRIGMKRISELYVTITNSFGENAKFLIEPFGFKVGNHAQTVTQNISTHNQISIEGRGVIDASKMGTILPTQSSTLPSQPIWRELKFTYVPTIQLPINIQQPSSTQLDKESTETFSLDLPIKNTSDFNSNNSLENSSSSNSQNITSDYGGFKAYTKIDLKIPTIINTPPNTFSRESSFPTLKFFIPSTLSYDDIRTSDELKYLIQNLNSESKKSWHISLSGSNNFSRIFISNLILQAQNFIGTRKIIGLKDGWRPGDFAALLTNIQENFLLEIDNTDGLFLSDTNINEIFLQVIERQQIDICIGEGAEERIVSLDLPFFSSITYCGDINALPLDFIDFFDCHLTILDDHNVSSKGPKY